MHAKGRTTYYFDWIEVGKRKRQLSNHRILLYGNFFMHEARYSTMKACHCLTDAICTNKPLSETESELRHSLTTHTYSLVVLGEGAGLNEAPNCEYIQRLQLRYPYTRFILSTTPPYWMLPERYRGDEESRRTANARCRTKAAELGLPLLDVDAWARDAGLETPEAAHRARTKLFFSYLKQFRISKAIKALRTENTPRNTMKAANSLLALMLGKEMSNIAAQGAPTPEITWSNKWAHEEANALIIGDSNTRQLCRANQYLTERVNMFATAAPMLSAETTSDIYNMLGPNITHVCFSIGGHYLQCWEGDDFDNLFLRFLQHLKQNNRHVLILTLTHWAIRGKHDTPDLETNERIDRLNSRMIQAAQIAGVQVMDMNGMMQSFPHADYVHYVNEAYTEPATRVADWFQSGGCSVI